MSQGLSDQAAFSQAALEHLGIGFLVFCCGGVQNTAASARNFRRMASADLALSLIGICHSWIRLPAFIEI